MEYDQQTLKALTKGDEVIVYFTTGDRDHPEIEWRVYGHPPTRQIIVRARVGEKQFFASRTSPLAYPLMEDRVFGIDVADSDVADTLSAELWDDRGDEIKALLGKG